MNRYDLEVAAYAAAHKIYSGLSNPDRATPGGFRSAVIDQIAETIKETLSIHISASSESSASPVPENVRQGHGWITGTADIGALNGQAYREPQPGLEQTRYWREMRHAFDNGGMPGISDRPCLKCGMPDYYGSHFNTSGVPLQGEAHLLVERARSGRAANSNEANL